MCELCAAHQQKKPFRYPSCVPNRNSISTIFFAIRSEMPRSAQGSSAKYSSFNQGDNLTKLACACCPCRSGVTAQRTWTQEWQPSRMPQSLGPGELHPKSKQQAKASVGKCSDAHQRLVLNRITFDAKCVWSRDCTISQRDVLR